jgi:pimeloyl-ACP methyl ester carboxylesterase
LFGAALALAYALEHPDRTELVDISCVVRLDGHPDWYEQHRLSRLERRPALLRGRYLRAAPAPRSIRADGSVAGGRAVEAERAPIS